MSLHEAQEEGETRGRDALTRDEIYNEIMKRRCVEVRDEIINSDTTLEELEQRLGDMWLVATAALLFGVLWGVFMTSQYLESVMRGGQ